MTGLGLKFFLLFTGIIFLSGVSGASAQELEPRTYTHIPVGLNFFIAGYAYTAGGVIFDPTIPLDNANIKIHGTVLAFARSIKIGGLSGKFDMILPYGWLSGSAEYEGQPVSRDISGLGDPRFRMTVNLLGAPPLSLSEYKGPGQKLVVGASLQVNMPLSQYDPVRLVNIGTNRFAFKPEIGISRAFGQLSLELATGVSFFTTNNDFYGGKTRSQSPISSVQAHGIYSFKGGIWVALDGTFYWGGKTTVDGVTGSDLQQNSRFGLTCAFPVNMHHSLKCFVSTGVSTRTGTDYDVIGLAWQYRWGKGFPK